MEEMQFAVPVLLGLEGICAREMRKLGVRDVRAENGRVTARGDMADLARLNLGLRTGERVQLVLGEFRAVTFEELFQGTKNIPWEDYIPRSGAFPVKGYSRDSVLHSVPSCQAIIKKAAAVRLGEKYGLSQLPENGSLYQIQFGIRKDCVTVSLDTSGDSLHKRGYRAVGVAAPLRETLAAAMILLSRYWGKDLFCDPFCGSGTIPIEAALIARNRAPGLNRRFAAENWQWQDPAVWKDVREELRAREFDGQYEIRGSDIDPAAVQIAEENARKAGVGGMIRWETADAAAFTSDEPYGRIVTNPPYGERVLDRNTAMELYRSFGEAVQKLPDTWRVAVLSSHTEFERAFGRTADRRRKLYNGRLQCWLYQYGK